MIQREDILPLSFIKKSPYTGSCRGKRYRLEQSESELLATFWEGPFCYDKTDPAIMKRQGFPFSEEGIEEAILWMNQFFS